jgi:hypothetical protein
MITKEQWLNLVSKVDQTFEDEFKAEYNSPELMFQVVQRLLKQCSVSGSFPLPFVAWYSGMDEVKIINAYERWKVERQ